jgi:hypothetical protein
VGPRPLSDVVVRPLNFTVRSRRVLSFFYLLSTVVVLIAPDHRAGLRPWWHYLVSAVVLFLVGWFLLRRADSIAVFAYRSGSSDASDS